jgi:hypothetical protein
LFPSLDPSIFEIKYPNNDIVGRARSFGWYILFLQTEMQQFTKDSIQWILV